MMSSKNTLLIGLALTLLATHCPAEEIDVRTYGVRPDTKENMVPAVRQMLAACQGKEASISFPKGRYDFYPDKPDDVTIAFHIKGMKDVTVDGGGAEFVFHGMMMPVRVEDSERITVQNFSVDWDRPYMTQGRISAITDEFVELTIDKDQYPYVIQDGRTWFTSPDWAEPRPVRGYNDLYDRTTKEFLYLTRDRPLRMNFNGKSEEVRPGVVRFYGKPRIKPPLGTYIVLNHGRYIVKGFDLVESKDITLKNLTVYHILSGCVVAARTENITVDAVNMVPRAEKGRVFTGIADGIHLIHCKGHVLVNDCSLEGQGDDFLNIHGRNAVVVKQLNDRTVQAVRADCIAPGDEVWLVRQKDVQRREVYTVAAIRRVEPTHKLAECETHTYNGIDIAWGISTDKAGQWEVAFTEPLPEDFGEGDVFENKTWNASLTMTNCRVLKKHRARGILLTTPEKTVIENNYFRTAGTAILIEGDTSFWFESGATTDVLIRNNVFEDCMTSGGVNGGIRGAWGNAIISITPSHLPKTTDTEPYHRNIRIEGNIFKTFDLPLVRARSVRGLTFRENTVERTNSFPPFAWQKASFRFEGCRDVELRNNRYDDAYEGRLIWTEHMRPSDLTVEDGRTFQMQDPPEE